MKWDDKGGILLCANDFKALDRGPGVTQDPKWISILQYWFQTWDACLLTGRGRLDQAVIREFLQEKNSFLFYCVAIFHEKINKTCLSQAAVATGRRVGPERVAQSAT